MCAIFGFSPERESLRLARTNWELARIGRNRALLADEFSTLRSTSATICHKMVKRGLCGTFGCTLPDRHAGLHEVSFAPRRSKQPKIAPEEAERIDKVPQGPAHQAVLPELVCRGRRAGCSCLVRSGERRMLIGKVDLAAERVAAEEVRKRGLYVDDVPGQHFKLASVVPDMNTSLVCPPIDEKLPHLGSLAMLSAQPSTYESVEDEDAATVC